MHAGVDLGDDRIECRLQRGARIGHDPGDEQRRRRISLVRLYTSGTYGTVWSTSNTVSYSPTSLATTSFTVYGQIPALQNVVVGSYTDSITATVTF